MKAYFKSFSKNVFFKFHIIEYLIFKNEKNEQRHQKETKTTNLDNFLVTFRLGNFDKFITQGRKFSLSQIK